MSGTCGCWVLELEHMEFIWCLHLYVFYVSAKMVLNREEAEDSTKPGSDWDYASERKSLQA